MNATASTAAGLHPGVTVSVTSHGQGALVEALVADLRRIAPAQVRRVVVTLNIPEREPVLALWPGVALDLLRNDRALGFGANHNQAFRRCDTEWFAVLNPDLRIAEDPFIPLLAAADERDALLAPAILESDGRPADAARRVLTPWQLLRRATAGRVPAGRDFDWLAGMFLLVRSTDFRALGGFDERYFMYSEDADLCLRLQLAGRHIRQIGTAQVTHEAQRASHRSWRHFAWHVASVLRHWTSSAYWRYLRRRAAIRAARPG